MRVHVALLFCLFLTQLVHASETRIPAYRSAFHVGETVMACGVIVQVHEAQRAYHLNFDQPYPNQTLGILIWKSNVIPFTQRFGDLRVFENRRACVVGEIELFRDRLQVQVRNPQLLRLMNQ